MKKFLLFVMSLLTISVSSSYAQTNVRGYYKKNGTYVQPHQRSTRNNTNWDNYSTSGNRNPYNGSNGSRAKDYTPGATNYGAGQSIYTGPQGGQYYYNNSGNKTYVPKQPQHDIFGGSTNSNKKKSTKSTGYYGW